MTTLIIIYFLLSGMEFIHFISETNKVESAAATIPAGDLNYYRFRYPSKALLKFFFPAYLCVKGWIKIVKAIQKHL